MNWQQRDRSVIWHPYTQMKQAIPPIPIVRGEGACLYDEQGNRYIDAIASWWVNLHGHSHPYIAQKVATQLTTLEHSIFAGFTHPTAIELAERLLAILPANQQKAFYSDNGSTAVEVALKMALQYWYNKGEQRTKIIAFNNAYHGDTFGAMAVSVRSAFTKPFDALLFDVEFIDLPTSENIESLKFRVSSLKSQAAAFIFEPIVQGTAGMLMYEASALDELVKCCKEQGILTISDEVMTGFGRTGELFASLNLQYQPDMFCLSKGITGGTMALGLTTCTLEVFDAFLSDDKLKTLFHGHSYTANPVACAAALASLDLLLADECVAQRRKIEAQHQSLKEQLKSHPLVQSVRVQGTILALDIQSPEGLSYFSSIRDRLYNFFIAQKVLLRPLGNTVYIMPPYCIQEEELQEVYSVIKAALEMLAQVD